MSPDGRQRVAQSDSVLERAVGQLARMDSLMAVDFAVNVDFVRIVDFAVTADFVRTVDPVVTADFVRSPGSVVIAGFVATVAVCATVQPGHD